MSTPLSRPAVPGTLSDDDLRARSRAVAVLLQSATLADGTDRLSGYRDLVRETLLAVEAHHGAQAALSLVVDELVRALNDPGADRRTDRPTDQPQPSDMNVTIIGAGIGGLTAALSLHAAGIRCRVYEATSQIRPLGVGINVLPHAVKELEDLGLLPALEAAGVLTREVIYATRRGDVIWTEPRGRFAGYRWPQVSIHRGALQMLLYQAVIEQAGARGRGARSPGG